MKNVIWGLIAIGFVVLIIWWLRGAKDSPSPDIAVVTPVVTEPTTPPPTQISPQEAPTQASKPIRTITTKNNMRIEIMKEGSGAAIANSQTATVDYIGVLQDGTVFDASKKRGNDGFSFTVGAGNVIQGWDEGVLGMKVGEVRVLTIPPELAYGPNGYPPVIPPNATLTFEVTLLAIK